MLRKTTKFIGRGVAFIASCAAFTASLAAYPFIAVYIFGSLLFSIWDDFFTFRNIDAEQQRKNSTQYDSTLVGKFFLRQVGMSFLSPILTIFAAIPITLSFSKTNAETVYSNLSTATDFDVDQSQTPIRHATVNSIGTSNTFYQEPRQQTLLHTQRAVSAAQASDAQSNDNGARINKSCTIS